MMNKDSRDNHDTILGYDTSKTYSDEMISKGSEHCKTVELGKVAS